MNTSKVNLTEVNLTEVNLTEIKKEIIKGAMDNSEAIIESWEKNLGGSPFKLTRKNLSRELNKISSKEFRDTINQKKDFNFLIKLFK